MLLKEAIDHWNLKEQAALVLSRAIGKSFNCWIIDAVSRPDVRAY